MLSSASEIQKRTLTTKQNFFQNVKLILFDINSPLIPCLYSSSIESVRGFSYVASKLMMSALILEVSKHFFTGFSFSKGNGLFFHRSFFFVVGGRSK